MNDKAFLGAAVIMFITVIIGMIFLAHYKYDATVILAIGGYAGAIASGVLGAYTNLHKKEADKQQPTSPTNNPTND